MRQIFCTYDVTTNESAEQGDFADHGWYADGFRYAVKDKPEEGFSCEPDEDDIVYDSSAIELAVAYLTDKGVSEPSSSCFHAGIWYSTESTVEDYSTNEHVRYSFHLDGFTGDEEQAIYTRVRAGEGEGD